MGKGLEFKLYKQEIIAGKGVITSNHPLASSAGAEMYAKDGNAFDAAVATLFALTVVEPMMVSIFGAGFFVVRDGKTGKVETLDNYAVAPFAAHDRMYEMVKERLPGMDIFETVGRKNIAGPLAVASPGTLKAWEHINRKYGDLSFKEVTQPAIRLAREGYRSSHYMEFILSLGIDDMKKYPETAKTYLPEGKPVKPGTLITLPEYAESLDLIAKQGSDAMYNGELGKAVVDYMEDNGGILTARDLREYKLIERKPVTGTYRDDYQLYAMAPGSSGGTHIIQMLNILENFDVPSMGFGSVEHLHLMAETLKIAFADRQQYMGDPAVVDIPLEGLLDKKYAEKRAGEIGETAKQYSHGEPQSYKRESNYTTHLSAMDNMGNMVAATQTLNWEFGSKVTVPGIGITLNNCMALFDPRPGRANSVAGGKRMLSSMSPTLILRKGEPYLCIGTPGGLKIFPTVAQAIINIIDFKMSIQEAGEAPRIWTMGIKGTPGEKLIMENVFTEQIRAELEKRGHIVFPVNRIAGGMNGVLRDSSGMLHGGACWRADGAPMGVSGGRTSHELLDPDPPY